MNIVDDLSPSLLRATESAAFSSYKTVGMKDEILSDQEAVHAMRNSLNKSIMDGTIVIGEGERDCAPMLYIGEKVGNGMGLKFDLALDPLEGTSICAYSKKGGSMSVIAAAEKGGFLNAPDVYMDKIAVGRGLTSGIVSLNNTISTNLYNLAHAKKCHIRDLIVVVLNRERHFKLINDIKECGAQVKLIDDGDVGAVISLIFGDHDLYVGMGGSPEGILAASVLHSLGGQFEGRLIFDTESLKIRAESFGIDNIEKIYSTNELIKKESIFVATGVTDGDLIKGIKENRDHYLISSVIITYGNIQRLERTVYK